MRTLNSTALITLLLAGCGGGSGETSVSASPPASQPPTAVAPAPTASAPSLPAQPPAQPPAGSPPPAQPPATASPSGPTINGAIVSSAMATNTAGRGGPWGYAEPVSFAGDPVYVFQSSAGDTHGRS